MALILRREFEAIEDDIKVSALEGGNELVPLVLDHFRFNTQLCSQGISQFAFKSDQFFGVPRVRIDVRRSSFRIGPPEQDAALADVLQLVGMGPRAP